MHDARQPKTITQTPQQPKASRVIGLFISFTFREMQAERDRLLKFTFLQLLKLCVSPGVT